MGDLSTGDEGRGAGEHEEEVAVQAGTCAEPSSGPSCATSSCDGLRQLRSSLACPVSELVVGAPPRPRFLGGAARRWVRHQRGPLCWLTALAATSHGSRNNEDLKQQNSELQERLRVLETEKKALQLGTEELQKKLEMSELLLQQVRACAGAQPQPQPAGASPGLSGRPRPRAGTSEPLFWSCPRSLPEWLEFCTEPLPDLHNQNLRDTALQTFVFERLGFHWEGKGRQTEMEGDLPSTSSFSKCLQQPGLKPGD